MAQGSGLTRGDRNRNRRIEALREVVRRDRAVLAMDLGEDKQVAALVDHEGRVLARRIVKAKAHQLGGLLGWAAEQAARAGFAGVVVACEPTGHRWKALMGLADGAGHGFCCVQSLAVARAREGDDYTRDKTDHRDAYLIGKLAVRLDCYLPERAEETWARLRHLGARRFALVADVVACQAADRVTCWRARGRRRWARRPGRWSPRRGWPRWGWSRTGAAGTRPGCGRWAMTGSWPRCAASCPGGAAKTGLSHDRDRGCGRR